MHDKCRAQLLKNYLPIAFFVANAIALAWPLPGQKVANPEVNPRLPLLHACLGLTGLCGSRLYPRDTML